MGSIALVDCNSFYCSSQAVFEPHLWTSPLVVLFNNDGSVVFLNETAKALGIKKTQPFFQCRELMQSANLAVRSSNFALYGDMSHRVMETLREFSSSVEVYSVDEAFLCLKHILPQSRTEYRPSDPRNCPQYTGIPISIGIAETKTLAKVANKIAKHSLQLEGVLDITEAIATSTARAAYNLRREHLATSALSVFVSSSRFKDNYYYNSARSNLLTASNRTPTLIEYALLLTQRLWRDDVEFAKAGVRLTKLTDKDVIQLSLFNECER